MRLPPVSPGEAVASPTQSDRSLHVSPGAKWLTLLTAGIGLFMLYVDLFIVTVALPAIGRDFHASVGLIAWTVTGYVLMIGVLPLGMGRLGDLWGHRAVYLWGLAIFLAASLTCGLAPTIWVLLVCRVAQGVGAAMMTPSTLALVTRAFSVEQRGLALGIYGGVSSLGLIAGPLLGGILVTASSWRWVFLINVPLGVFAIVMTLIFVPRERPAGESIPVDWWGLLVFAAGVLGLLLALTHGALDAWTVAAASLGAICLLLFGVIERRMQWPLFDMALLRNRAFVATTLSFLFFSAALFGSQPYWSLFLQNTWGFSPFQGGLAFLPATGLIAALTPASGLIGQVAGKHVSRLAALGAGLMGLGFGAIALILTTQSAYATSFLPIFVLRGIGIPVFVTCGQLVMLASVPADQIGVAAGTLGMARNVGTALGIALLGGVYAHTVAAQLPTNVAAAARAGANQFLNVASAPTHGSLGGVILHGFMALNFAAALCCGVAFLAMLAQRPHSAAPQQPESK